MRIAFAYLNMGIPHRAVREAHGVRLTKPKVLRDMLFGIDEYDKKEISIPLTNIISIHWSDDGVEEPF